MNKIVRIGNRKNTFSYFLTNCLHIPEYSDCKYKPCYWNKGNPNILKTDKEVLKFDINESDLKSVTHGP